MVYSLTVILLVFGGISLGDSQLLSPVKSNTGKYEFCPPDYDHDVDLPTTRPLIIAHQGFSGRLPSHTKEAYSLAVDYGADVIECDVCVTKDLHLVCLHESWLNGSTDVAVKFNASRMNTYYIIDNDENVTDYFSVDFTLAELKTLRVREKEEFRDPNHDYLYEIATLEEYIGIAQNAGRPVGIYPETKEPKWVNSLDIIKEAQTTFEDLLVGVLERYGYTSKTDPCFIQSFRDYSIDRLRNITELPLIMLYNAQEISNETLQDLAQYCYGIGIGKEGIIQINESGQIAKRTDLVARAHAFGLRVHPWTFRNEDRYLAWDYGQDAYLEYADFLSLGVDGYFTDFSDTLYRFLDNAYYRRDEDHPQSPSGTTSISFKHSERIGGYLCAILIVSLF